jgi:hypothetical protein
MLVDHLGAARTGQIAHLRGFVAKIDCAGRELQVEFNRFALEVKDSEFHAMRVKQRSGISQPCEQKSFTGTPAGNMDRKRGSAGVRAAVILSAVGPRTTVVDPEYHRIFTKSL